MFDYRHSYLGSASGRRWTIKWSDLNALSETVHGHCSADPDSIPLLAANCESDSIVAWSSSGLL